MRSTVLRFGSVFAILALVLAACGGQTGQSEDPGSGEPAASGALCRRRRRRDSLVLLPGRGR